MKNPLSEMLEEIISDAGENGTAVFIFFKCGAASHGALRAARRKGGDRIDGLYEYTCPMPMMDPATGREVIKLVSQYFTADAVESLGVVVDQVIEAPRSGGIIIPH